MVAVRLEQPEDIHEVDQVNLAAFGRTAEAFDTESNEPGRKVLIERAVSEGNAYVGALNFYAK